MSKIKIPYGRHRPGHVGAPVDLDSSKRGLALAARADAKYKEELEYQSRAKPVPFDWNTAAKRYHYRRTEIPGSTFYHFALTEIKERDPERPWEYPLPIHPALCGSTVGTAVAVFQTNQFRCSLPVIHLRWVTCKDCKVMLDWAQEHGILALNADQELVDPDPENPDRKKLRKNWRRFIRSFQEHLKAGLDSRSIPR